MAMTPRTGERGSILISVLALAILLGFLAAVASIVTRAAHGSGRAFSDDVRAEQAARATIEKLVAESGGTADLMPYTTLAFRGLTTQASLRDEAGRIDLNTAPPELIAGVFVAVGASPDFADLLAARVVDWRDEDDSVSKGGGAERSAYAGTGRADGPANRPFVHVAELGLVLGIPPAVAAAASPYFTVASKLATVNPLSASREVLLAIPGTDPARVQDFIETREKDTGLPFKSLAARLGTGAAKYLSDGRGKASRVLVTVSFSPRNLRRFEAIIADGSNGEPYRVVSWQSGVAPVPSARP